MCIKSCIYKLILNGVNLLLQQRFMFFLCNLHITKGHTWSVNSPSTRQCTNFSGCLGFCVFCSTEENWSGAGSGKPNVVFSNQHEGQNHKWLWSVQVRVMGDPAQKNPRLQKSLGFISLDSQYSAFISHLQPQTELGTGMINLYFKACVPTLDWTYF